MRGRGCMAVTRDGTNFTLLDLRGLGLPSNLLGLLSISPVRQEFSIASFVDVPAPFCVASVEFSTMLTSDVSVLISSVDFPATVSGSELLIDFPAAISEVGGLLVDITSSVEAVVEW